MTTRSSTATSGTFFPVSVLISLIVLIGTFFAVLQTASLPLLPSSLSRVTTRAPFFRGLIYLPRFRFMPLFRSAQPDLPATIEDESHMAPAELIDVKVEDGWVTLSGAVSWQLQNDAAYQDVANLFGVVGITNEIKVINP